MTEVYFAQVKLKRNVEPPCLFDVTPDLKALALEDVKGMRQSLRLSSKKTVLEGAAPGEVWWLLFSPNRFSIFRLVLRSQPLSVSCFW